MATTFENTWQFDLNRAYTPASALDLTRYTMWYIAAALTGNIGGMTLGLWTLYGSSDSVTAGYDATDRWVLAGPYDGTKIVRGSGAAAHSWVVLQSPLINGITWYMCLSFNTASDATIRVSYSRDAMTGGSTTLSPPATVSTWYPMASSTPSAAADFTINAAATDSSRFSVGLTTGGEWYFVGCKQLAGNPNLWLTFRALKDYDPADQLPVWSPMGYQATGAARWAVAGNGVFSTGSATSLNHRRFDNTNSVTNCAAFWWRQSTSGTDDSQISASAINGRYIDQPVWIGYNLAAAGQPSGIRGRVADYALCPYLATVIPEGTVTPSTGPIESCKCGNLWLPANAAFNFL